MFTLITALILFFAFLIIYQAYLANKKIFEGLDNMQNDDGPANSSSCSSSVLAYKNTASIQTLQEQMNKLLGLDKTVQDISGNVSLLNNQVLTLTEEIKKASTQLAGNKPIVTTGLSSAPVN